MGSEIREALRNVILHYMTNPFRSVPIQTVRDIRDGRFMEYDDKQLTEIVRNMVTSEIKKQRFE